VVLSVQLPQAVKRLQASLKQDPMAQRLYPLS
jgi:hypothetical protein